MRCPICREEGTCQTLVTPGDHYCTSCGHFTLMKHVFEASDPNKESMLVVKTSPKMWQMTFAHESLWKDFVQWLDFRGLEPVEFPKSMGCNEDPDTKEYFIGIQGKVFGRRVDLMP